PPILDLDYPLPLNVLSDTLGPFRPCDAAALAPRLCAFAALSAAAGDVFADLGCGDARVLLEVARRVRVECRGVELEPLVVPLARAALADAQAAADSAVASTAADADSEAIREAKVRVGVCE